MTPAEALRAAAARNDEPAIRGLLSELSEAERAGMIPVARELVATDTKKGIDAVGGLGPTLLMAYGLLPVSDIRKLGWRSNHLPDRLQDVLRRRSPERLVPIVEYLLDDFGFRAWQPVRVLVREGIVPRPARPSYTIAMLAATRYRGAVELLAEDPALLEDEVWRLFEVEGGGEDSLANHEKFFGDTWGQQLRSLAARDDAARQRLLDASLAALARDFATYRAGWFSRFHESLAPTDDERVERAQAYLGLLRSRVGPTVSLAVAALARIQRAGRLPADALLDSIGPVLIDGSARNARIALDLVGRAGARTPGDARSAAIVAADALSHESPEVQGRAIALIGRLVPEVDDQVAQALASRVPDVSASQQSAAAELLARLTGEPGAPSSVPAAEDAGHPGRVPAAPARVSATDPARAVEPLATVEALVDLAVSVVETGEPAIDVERVLDAVGRLAGERPDKPSRLTNAVARRARTILARRESSALTGVDARADVAAVLLAWAAGEPGEPGASRSSARTQGLTVTFPGRGAGPGSGAFLSARARELAEAVAAGRTFVSVALPTHAGGWIDPASLVQRLTDRPPASRLDLVAAILRLAPDGRDTALHAAADLGGEPGAVLRYALGGNEPIGPTAAWWVAAARVRAPGHDDELVEQRHPRLGPDAGRAARIAFRVRDSGPHHGRIALDVQPDAPDEVGVDLPTVLLFRDGSSSFGYSGYEPAMLRWMAMIQPGHREAWAAVGSVPIARNLDWWSAEWANRVFLEPFVDPVTTMGPHARRLIGIALGAKEAGERGLASDVVGLALTDGRMTASDLAAALTAAAAADCDRPLRWAISLADVATISRGHATAVAEAIAPCLAAIADRPKAKLVPLLRLLDELLAGSGTPPAADGRPSLERLAGASGQAGRLARSILSRG